MPERLLVTGGSGFIGGHCVRAALDAGHAVRTTTRSLDGANRLRSRFEGGDRLEVVAADLLRSELGERAVKVPRRTLPTPLVRAVGRFVPSMVDVSAELGIPQQISTRALREVLRVEPRPAADVVLACARSLPVA